MKMKLFCMAVLCTCLFIACDKDNDDYEPVKPPMEQPEQPEEPDEPVTPPSTDDIINVKIGDLNMIVGSNNWNSVVYGNGKYVAVGANGYVTTSTNGTTWSNPFQVDKNVTWLEVKFLNGNFIAVGNRGSIMISSDGNSWKISRGIRSESTEWATVTFGNGNYLIIATGGYKYYSADGETWTAGNLAGNYEMNGATYGNNLFVVCSTNEIQYTSSPFNTNNWDFVSIRFNNMNIYWTDCIYVESRNQFVIVGYSYTNTTKTGWTATSTDAKTWTTPKAIEDLWIKGITYKNGKFVVIGLYGYVSTSTDGITWATPEQIKDESGKIVTANLYGICVVPN